MIAIVVIGNVVLADADFQIAVLGVIGISVPMTVNGDIEPLDTGTGGLGMDAEGHRMG